MRFRRQPTVTRVDRPTSLARARTLGYKAKQGIIVGRVRVGKGMRKRPKFSGGRRPKARGRFFPPGKSKRQIGEEKAAKRYPNLEVLNSYFVGEDGDHKWFEIILIDRSHPAIIRDKRLGWVSGKRGRAFRGLTSAGQKTRGLRN